MTRVAFINPNSTIAMTTSCARSFVAQLPKDYHVEAITNHQAPTAIQGPEDGDAAVPGVLNIISNGNFDAYVIACFDDTGLAEARTITQKPVIGIGQASFHLAALSSGRFSVLTTLAVSIPVIAENIEAQGFGQFAMVFMRAAFQFLTLRLRLTNHAESSRHICKKWLSKIPAMRWFLAVLA